MIFATGLNYTDRKTKAEYVFDKYKQLLAGKVLDVGADAMYLKPLIVNSGGAYVGIGYGQGIDYEINLESTPYPFQDKQFDTVLCLDVLEHLENIHQVFDELCRISKTYIVVSLPNPWAEFFSVLRKGDYSEAQQMKFYGLPANKPLDRHRWFFSEKEGMNFIKYCAQKNGWELLASDSERSSRQFAGEGWTGVLARCLLKSIFRRDIDSLGLHHGTSWFVLRKV